MILTCPSCETQFRVAADAVGQGGRVVRCASCKHQWHAYPDDQAAELSPPIELPADEPEEQAPELGSVEEPGLVAFEEGLRDDAPTDVSDELDDDFTDEVVQPEEPLADEPEEDDTPAEPLVSPEEADGSFFADDEPAQPVIHFADEEEYEDDAEAVANLKPLAIAAGVLLVAILGTLTFLVKPAFFGATPSKGMVLTDIEMRERKGRDNVRYIVEGSILNETANEQPVPTIRIAVMSAEDKPILSREYVAADGATVKSGSTIPFRADNLQTTQVDKVSYLLVDLGNGAELMKRPLHWVEE